MASPYEAAFFISYIELCCFFEDQIIANQISEAQLQKLRKKIIILGEITVVLSVIILFLAALLNSGGEI